MAKLCKNTDADTHTHTHTHTYTHTLSLVIAPFHNFVIDYRLSWVASLQTVILFLHFFLSNHVLFVFEVKKSPFTMRL